MKMAQIASICGIPTKSNANEIELIRDIEHPYQSDRCQMLEKKIMKKNEHTSTPHHYSIKENKNDFNVAVFIHSKDDRQQHEDDAEPSSTLLTIKFSLKWSASHHLYCCTRSSLID